MKLERRASVAGLSYSSPAITRIMLGSRASASSANKTPPRASMPPTIGSTPSSSLGSSHRSSDMQTEL